MTATGTKKTLTPVLYRAILDEAQKFDVPVAVHNVKQADAKEMVRDGIEGWLHVPVRQGEVADDEMVDTGQGPLRRTTTT